MNVQRVEITVVLMQIVRIQWARLHVLVLLDLMGMVLFVQASVIHSKKHVFFNYTSMLSVGWYLCQSYHTISLTSCWEVYAQSEFRSVKPFGLRCVGSQNDMQISSSENRNMPSNATGLPDIAKNWVFLTRCIQICNQICSNITPGVLSLTI